MAIWLYPAYQHVGDVLNGSESDVESVENWYMNLPLEIQLGTKCLQV